MKSFIPVICFLLILVGCSRNETGDVVESPDPVDVMAEADPGNLIPRRPHHPTASLIQWETDEPGTGKVEELTKAMDRYLAREVPDFAIKDSSRPWLDKQYVPEQFRVTKSDGTILGELTMRVLQWDEGRPREPLQLSLTLEWNGNEWIPVALPAQFEQDLRNAATTLQSDWQPGERQLP